MHGLVFFAIQAFVADTVGAGIWARIAARLGLDPAGFEPMLPYDAALLPALVDVATLETGKHRAELLEDLGTYVVSHPRCAPIRRLLRYGGADYAEFLVSLNELPDRILLALPDFDVPDLTLSETAQGQFRLTCTSEVAVFAPVMVGVLRAMADDYGALVYLDLTPRQAGVDDITISLISADFAEGRAFHLGNSRMRAGQVA